MVTTILPTELPHIVFISGQKRDTISDIPRMRMFAAKVAIHDGTVVKASKELKYMIGWCETRMFLHCKIKGYRYVVNNSNSN